MMMMMVMLVLVVVVVVVVVSEMDDCAAVVPWSKNIFHFLSLYIFYKIHYIHVG